MPLLRPDAGHPESMPGHRLADVLQGLRFVSVGLANTFVTIGTIFVAIDLVGLNDIAANAIGYAAGFACGFVMNRNWTFRSRSTARKDLMLYAAAFLVAYILNILLVILLESLSVGRLPAQAMGVPAYTMCFFVLCRMIVFRHV